MWLIWFSKHGTQFHCFISIIWTFKWCVCEYKASVQFSSVAKPCPTLQPHELQHARPPCPSPTPGVHSNSHPSSRWCHPAISVNSSPWMKNLEDYKCNVEDTWINILTLLRLDVSRFEATDFYAGLALYVSKCDQQKAVLPMKILGKNSFFSMS